jgi:hypothetical protein
LGQINEQIAANDAQIQALEKTLEDKYGDSWREDTALKVMGPDDIPERKPGESIQEWRERVEQALVREMIDPVTGKLKEQYKNHPDQAVREIGEWAERMHAQSKNHEKANELRVTFEDPNIPDEIKQAKAESVSADVLYRTDDIDNNKAMAETVDKLKDETLAKPATADAASSFLS